MQHNRILNFNAGPAALPLIVLEEIRDSFLDFKGSGMSITEVSHRSKWFDDVINDAIERTKRLLKLDDKFKVLFVQGGASMQFAMMPMNFLHNGKTADYVNTGTWSTKAIKEAEIQGKNFNVVASSEDKNFSYIPKNINFNHKFLDRSNTIKEEARELFDKAIYSSLIKNKQQEIKREEFSKQYEDLTEAIPEELFPPCIKKMLEGLEDGKKRSLFVTGDSVQPRI